MQRRQLIAASGVGAGALTLPSVMKAAKAQTAPWPTKPIRNIVAFAAGGQTDSYARLYVKQLKAKFGIQAIVENKPGAGAIIAIDAVAKSPADGYTLLMTTSGTVWQNRVPHTKLPYNLDKDIVPVAFYPSGLLGVGAPEKIGVNSMRELIDCAKKNPTNMAVMRRVRTRKWWLTKPVAMKVQRLLPSTTGANHRCGWTSLAGKCK